MIDLDLIVIYTERLEEVRAFYAGLGLEFTEERHGRGPAHHAAVLGPTVLELYPAGERPPTGRLRLGLTLPAGPASLPPGPHTLTDPDGRTVAVTVTA
ncbi:hypothetical protein Ssi03_03910 [Sphaerisporangium siamense]|uniref:Catechol 2,3-dioxygenase-like lactoylglutathione lyase family enzyme n=1 Tax=Sphaerisporangium siamense TaxID=795645 RepID=A0A7W7GCI8_9ACTN|nr:glyoxalase/bleomycin resistance/dioxygenase family protein [Sphaerisporangium siamense]MBB4703930.1 catechol 2,3-dioxygenase-like lactoylglutathione lyase family enzyme [Sphaerisporangium siamense]GII82401.1 hypothetical protein Ssi03_03910 [Sphaerisporangium siamense]